MSKDLTQLPIEELAVSFGDLALAELEARDAYDIATAKRYRSELETVEAELKSRGEEGQAALIVFASLHDDKRVQEEAIAAIYRFHLNRPVTARVVRMAAKEGRAVEQAETKLSVPVAELRREELKTLSVGDLLRRLKTLAIAYDEEEYPPRANELSFLLDDIRDEFTRRDQWRGVLPLYFHSDLRVRQQAAAATYDHVPELVRDRERHLDEESWFPPEKFVTLFDAELLAGRTPRPSRLASFTIEKLVERFVRLALDKAQASGNLEIAKFNRLFRLAEAVELELKSRDGDQRCALLPLFDHPSDHVSLAAATATLAVSPDLARQRIEALVASKEEDVARDAAGRLEALAEGRFKHL